MAGGIVMEPEQTQNNQPNQQGDGPAPMPTPGQSIAPSQPPAESTAPYQTSVSQPSYDSVQSTNPIPQQPNAAQYFQPDQTAVPQPASPIMSTPSGLGMGKKLLIIAFVLVILAAVGAGAYLVFHKKKSQLPSSSSTTGTSSVVTQSYATAENTALAALKKDGSSLSSSSLASINATDLFYAVFRNAAEQPIVTTTTNSYYTTSLDSTTALPDNGVTISDINQAGSDYKSGQFSYQSSGSGLAEKCVNGVDYDISTLMADTWTKNTADNDNCQVANTTATINDGLNTGGLSTSQAQQFVDVIRDIKGLITVSSASLVTAQGQHYIQFNVSVNAKTDCYANSVPSGIGCFQYAFESLKLPKSWPYTLQATIVSGAQFAYIVDPTLQLPAYTQIAYTPVTASQGNWQNQQIEYAFGPLPTFQLNNSVPDPISMSWPVVQL